MKAPVWRTQSGLPPKRHRSDELDEWRDHSAAGFYSAVGRYPSDATVRAELLHVPALADAGIVAPDWPAADPEGAQLVLQSGSGRGAEPGVSGALKDDRVFFEDVPHQHFENFVTSGRRWTDAGTSSGRATSDLGASGGVVAWSVAGAGIDDTDRSDFYTGLSVDMADFLSFDYQAILWQAFDAWAQVANIEFIQVVDGGGQIGTDAHPTIRVVGGLIDGDGDTVARAYTPSANAHAGDIAFDSSEVDFWTPQSFYVVAAHEIGHAIGLLHETSSLTALMNPFFNGALFGTGPFGTALQTDDIEGIRAVYGTQDFGPNAYFMPTAQVNLTLIDGAPDLTINGNAAGNSIVGSSAGETLVGGEGNDVLSGGGGDDRLYGDFPPVSSFLGFGSGYTTLTQSANNNGFATAFDLTNNFTLVSDADIAASTTVPHSTVAAVGNGSAGYYTVSLGAPSELTIDIDRTSADFDSYVRLMNSAGTVLAISDDNGGDPGSTSFLDSRLVYAAAPGTYYIVIGSFEALDSIPPGAVYELNVSVHTPGLHGESGDDILNGGDGDDTLFWTGGFDILDGGAGTDELDFSSFGSAVLVSLNASEYEAWTRDLPTLTGGTWRAIADVANVENLIGTSYDDLLAGNASTDNRLEGGAGNDTLYVHGGLNALDGGAGIDTADFATFGAAVLVSLNASEYEAWTQNLPTLAGGTWRPLADLASVENLVGTAHDDELYGDSAANQLDGRAGNDLLLGGGGSDQLTGGAGMDRFVYNAIGQGIDTITDFESGSGNDALDFKDLLAGQAVNRSNISDYVRLTAAGADTIVAVDENGLTGGSAYVDIAVLQAITGLVATDMFDQGNLLVA